MRNRIKLVAAVAVLAGGIVAGGRAVAAQQDYAQTTLTGAWGGARQSLHDKGIDLTASFLGIDGYNLRGGDQHRNAFVDQFLVGGDVNFDKLFGWTGGSLHFILTNRNGHTLDSKANLGTLLQTQQPVGFGQVTRIVRFYLEQQVLNGTVDVKLGRMDVGAVFYPLTCDFINLTFCGTDPAYITQGMGGFPGSQLGATVTYRPSRAWAIKLGGFKVNPNQFLPENGLKLFNSGHNVGTLTMGELDWDTTLASAGPAKPLPGSWRIGGWHNSANFPDLFLASNGLPLALTSDDVPMLRNSISGFYFTGRQQVTYNAAGGGLTVVGRMVRGDSHTDTVDQIDELWILYRAPFASRAHDQIGFAVGRNHVNDRVADSVYLTNARDHDSLPIPGNEYPVELNYKFALARGISVTPSLQYIMHPGGLPSAEGHRNIVVMNLQLEVTL